MQLKFLKHILKLKRSTANYFVHGETGCMPTCVDIEERILSFWARLLIDENGETPSKLSYYIYRNILKSIENMQDEDLKKKYPWFYNVKSILIKCGFFNIWADQYFPGIKWLKLSVKRKLQNLFLSNWYSLVEDSPNSTFYKAFKRSFSREPYLSYSQNSLIFNFAKFRTRNHRLPVETGGWSRQPTPLNERFCPYCRNKIGDEFHYLFECNRFENERKRYLKRYYYIRPNMFKVEQLSCMKHTPTFFKLVKFLNLIIKSVRT